MLRTDSITGLDLPAQAESVLRRLGVRTVGQLLELSDSDLYRAPACGSVAARAIYRLQCELRSAVQRAEAAAQPESFAAHVLSLPPRAVRVLERLKVQSLEGFLNLRPKQVLSLRAVGRNTWLAIARAQAQLRRVSAQPPAPPPASAPHPEHAAFAANSACPLPLFADGQAQPQELHPSYFGDGPVTDLSLPARAATAMMELGIRTVGQLLCTPCSSLSEHRNFGELSLQATQDAVLDYLHRRNGLQPPLEMRSFERFANALLNRCLTQQRMRDVLAQRIGLATGEGATLEQIGRKMGLSRQRIQQIERKATRELRSGRSRHLLAPFLEVVHRCFAQSGGVVSPAQLATAVSTALRWSKVPRPATLARLVAACDNSYRFTAIEVRRQTTCSAAADGATAAIETVAAD